ncbi:nucleoside hydrolase [Anaerotignum lactatifermentans]|uniref:Nucleoside hydrolase n=1 Tax=Anaerotignum lactatifermentans TaxID=160404 RepID=A0ABS2GAL2_9FIRM|nr:nucleoside hydrolase [Anaerotignum lactatifermentans]MBM6829211.1 nucleoside hydrolase [Anaerotignum lactatifermentans]MBM6877549.1 nucleoside hydrolase [Anaerotignum lactatifermentans]MBM6950789.1 nucleoside hydrolase [Anaerotignum lactatifermentans]
MRKIPVILDGDPGHDDAIAWVLAKGSQQMNILGVTSVCGNQTIEKTTYNARRICTLIGLDVPMAMGRLRPLISAPIIAPTVHGESGLDGPALPEPAYPLLEMDAVSLMAKLLEESEEPVTLIPTGPLTNVAALLLAYPELKAKIARISLMGGGVQYGNWTPAAEFNILVDPEAADVVFSSGIPIIMAGLDVTEKAMIFPEDFERIRALGNPVAVIVAEWLEFFYQFHRGLGYEGAPVHDAVAVAALLKPEIMESQDLYVQVETAGEFCKGATVADFNGVLGKAPNAKVLMGIDRQAFVDLLVEAIETYGEGKA